MNFAIIMSFISSCSSIFKKNEQLNSLNSLKTIWISSISHFWPSSRPFSNTKLTSQMLLTYLILTLNWRQPTSLSRTSNAKLLAFETSKPLKLKFSSLWTCKEREPIWFSLVLSYKSPTTVDNEPFVRRLLNLLRLTVFPINFQHWLQSYHQLIWFWLQQSHLRLSSQQLHGLADQ